uniref:BAT2 N-terminal domain-containing protein n=2 Tax=Plectus sambesii TaxID=2011161 RepID=A0A914W8D3_9BILA
MSAFSSSSRSASGAAKGRFQQQNINSVFASKGSSASKASGPSKHGLQSLGKQTTAVRRMPPPATLPSLRAESAGQDPAVALVPQGGTGWGTQTQSSTDSGKSAVDSSVNGSTKLEQDQRNAAQGALSGRAGSSPSAGGPDLRPTWAKADQTPISATNTRDFPTLSAAATKTTPIPEGAGSLKPQKSGSWKAGGGSAQSKSELENQQNLLNQQAQEQKQLRGESVGEEQATTTTTSNRASIDRDSPHTATGGGADHAQPSTTRPYLASSTTSSNNPPNRGPPVPPPARYYGGGGGGYGSGGGGPAPYSQPPSLHHQQQQSKPPHGYGQQSNYGGGGAGMPPMHGSNQAPPPRGYGSQDARYQQSQSSPQNQNSGYPPPPQQQRPSPMYDGGGGGGAYGPPPMTSSRPPAYDVMPPSESPPVSSNRGDYQPTNQQQGGGYGPPHGGYARRPMPPPIAENDENYDDVDDYPGPYRRSDEPRVMWSDDEDSMGPPRGRGPPPHPSVRYQ